MNIKFKARTKNIFKAIKRASYTNYWKLYTKGVEYIHYVSNKMINRSIDSAMPTVQSKKQQRIFNFLKIWGNVPSNQNFIASSIPIINGTLHHSSNRKKIVKDENIKYPNTLANNPDQMFDIQHHNNFSGLSLKDSNIPSYIKSPSFFNNNKFNRLEQNPQNTSFTSEKPENNFSIGPSNKNQNKMQKPLYDQNSHIDYDFHSLIRNLEKDKELRKRFLQYITDSSILSKEIKELLNLPNRSNTNNYRTSQYSYPFSENFSCTPLFQGNNNVMTYQRMHFNQIHNGTNIIVQLDKSNHILDRIKRFPSDLPDIKQISEPRLTSSPDGSGDDRDSRTRASSPRSRVSSLSMSPTNRPVPPTNGSTTGADDTEIAGRQISASGLAFEISSKRIEDELQRQLETLNLNQQKLDLTLIKYRTEEKSADDLILTDVVMPLRPRKDRTLVNHKLKKALYTLTHKAPLLFSELLDDDLIYLAKFASRPVQVEAYPSLTYVEKDMIEKTLHYGPKDEIIVRGFGADIKRSDLNTLDHINWLNDEIMNFYLNMITERSKAVRGDTMTSPVGHDDVIVRYPSVHSFSTFFFTQLSTKGYQSVRRWTKKVDIFSKELIFVPVHIGAHWCMGIIDMVAKAVIYFDSLYSEPHDYYLSILMNYLEEESLDKRDIDFDSSDWKLINALNVPQQKNGSDCGMFALKYAEFCSRRENFTFSQVHMSYFRQRMILEIVSKKLSAP